MKQLKAPKDGFKKDARNTAPKPNGGKAKTK